MASSGHLKPQEKGKINVTVNAKGTLGVLSKTVQVNTNDPNKPLTILTLKMVVKGPGPKKSEARPDVAH